MNTSVGLELRRAREARSLSLEEVAHATHMRVHYLRALEEGDLAAIPSRAQAKGFLRAYADYLGLDPDPLTAGMGVDTQPLPGKAPTAYPVKPDSEPGETYGGSQQIFNEIGTSLREQRELLGLSIEDVENHTHLRRHYLLALEAGDLDGLPSPVQGRGMLNNYATFLGMDVEALMLRFADGLQAQHAAKHPSTSPDARRETAARTPASQSALRRFFSADVLAGLLISIGMIAFVAWGAVRIFAMQTSGEMTPTAPSIADVLLASPTATVTFTPQPQTPTPLPELPLLPTQAPLVNAPAVDAGAAPAGDTEAAPDADAGAVPEGDRRVIIYVAVQQRAWMRVTVDGEVEFEGRVAPGSAYNFAGVDAVEILTGNGAALQVFYDQVDLGLLGSYGQVVNRVYTAEGIVTATPTITQTPTETLPATSTPTLTATAAAGEVTQPANP